MPSLPDLLAAATARPWFAGAGEQAEDVNVWDHDGVPARAVAHDVFSDANRTLIVYAVNLLEAHAAVAEAAQRALDEVQPRSQGCLGPLRAALARLAEAEKEQGA